MQAKCDEEIALEKKRGKRNEEIDKWERKVDTEGRNKG